MRHERKAAKEAMSLQVSMLAEQWTHGIPFRGAARAAPPTVCPTPAPRAIFAPIPGEIP
jgi:hypothetical protein